MVAGREPHLQRGIWPSVARHPLIIGLVRALPPGLRRDRDRESRPLRQATRMLLTVRSSWPAWSAVGVDRAVDRHEARWEACTQSLGWPDHYPDQSCGPNRWQSRWVLGTATVSARALPRGWWMSGRLQRAPQSGSAEEGGVHHRRAVGSVESGCKGASDELRIQLPLQIPRPRCRNP